MVTQWGQGDGDTMGTGRHRRKTNETQAERQSQEDNDLLKKSIIKPNLLTVVQFCPSLIKLKMQMAAMVSKKIIPVTHWNKCHISAT